MEIKKITILLLILTMIVANFNIVYGQETTDIVKFMYDNKEYEYNEFVTINLNGKEVKPGAMPAIIIDEKTMVPAREVFETLGAQVEWNESDQKIAVILEDTVIVLQIGNKKAFVNDMEIELITEPRLVTNLDSEITKTMIPFRFVSEALGYDVIWDHDTYTAFAVKGQDDSKEENTPDTPDIPDIPDTPDTPDAGSNIPGRQLPTPLHDNPVEWQTDPNDINDSLDIADNDNELTSINAPQVNIKKVEYIEELGSKKFIITADDKISSVSQLLWDEKLIIDINNSKKEFDEVKITYPDNKFIEDIRSSQFSTEPMITRIVFELKDEKLFYSISYSDDRTQIIIDVKENYIFNISLEQNEEGDYVDVKGLTSPNVQVFRLTNPDRLVLDIPFSRNTIISNSQDVEGQYVNSIRTSQFDEETTRIVLDLEGQADYNIEHLDDQTTRVKILQPTYKKFQYNNLNGTAFVLKKDNNYKININDIKIEENYLSKHYKLTLPGNYDNSYGTGSININDGNIKDVQIKHDENGNTVLDVLSLKVGAIKIVEDEQNIYIKMVNPKEVYDKIIVLDAGHGGSDPGKPIGKGNYTGMNEKDINLNIALKLYGLLEADPNIKVYMTRLGDDYPSLQERCDLANEIEADLFVSIHSNAYESWVSGTETHYFDDGSAKSSINKSKATIIHQSLISATGMPSRGLKKNNGLFVLRKTAMSAILIETGYMTNVNDASQLVNESFRINAASGIYKGIKEVLK